jgi:hypothetical protein
MDNPFKHTLIMAENPDQSQPDTRQHSLFDAADPESNTAGRLMVRDAVTSLLAEGAGGREQSTKRWRRAW